MIVMVHLGAQVVIRWAWQIPTTFKKLLEVEDVKAYLVSQMPQKGFNHHATKKVNALTVNRRVSETDLDETDGLLNNQLKYSRRKTRFIITSKSVSTQTGEGMCSLREAYWQEAEHQAITNDIINGLRFPKLELDFKHIVVSKGNLSKVYRAKHNSSDAAVKLACLPYFRREESEGEVLRKVNPHPFIITFHASYTAGTVCVLEGVVTDYAVSNIGLVLDAMSSAGKPSGLEATYVRYLSTRIANAIAHIHLKGFAHLDICSSNVLLTAAGVPQVADFSDALTWSQGDLPLVAYSVGTLGFRAPEIISSLPYTTDADWFSYGVVVYHMLHGRLPWEKNDASQMMILANNDLKFATNIDSMFMSHIRRMFGLVPENRVPRYALQRVSRKCSVSPPETDSLKYAKTNVFVY